MIKENLISISLTRLGIEKSIDIPADMFFELMENIPHMIERIGLSKSKKQYADMWDSVDSTIGNKGNLSWFNSDNETKVLLRRCQILVALAAHLFEIPLILSGDGIVEKLEGIGGINITEQVENGSIPIEPFL
jgi:hypothetical protein